MNPITNQTPLTNFSSSPQERIDPQQESAIIKTDSAKEVLFSQESEIKDNLQEKNFTILSNENILNPHQSNLGDRLTEKLAQNNTQEPLVNNPSPNALERGRRRPVASEENSSGSSLGLYVGGGTSLAAIIFGSIVFKFNKDENHTYSQDIEYTSIGFIVFGCLLFCCGGATVLHSFTNRRRQLQQD